MRYLMLSLLLLAGCITAPQKPVSNTTTIVNHCSGQALAILAVTKPWALHDCVEPEGLK